MTNTMEMTRIPSPRPVTDLQEPLQKYGRMRKEYLENHHSGVYSSMMMAGSLDRHCLILQHQAEEYLEQLTRRMMEQEPVCGDPAADPAARDRKRFDIQALAEDTVLRQLICTF